MSETKELTTAEAQSLGAEMERAVNTLKTVAVGGVENVEDRADVGEVRWSASIVQRHEVENALHDVQEAVAKLLPHLPE